VVADPWRLVPRRPVPGGTVILTQFAFRRAQLVLADSGIVICSARAYALHGRLLLGPGGGHRVRGSQPAQPAAGLSLRPGDPQVNASLPDLGTQASAPVRRFAFKGRVSTEDNQDRRSRARSRGREIRDRQPLTAAELQDRRHPG
jgi:hypothetical protein